MLYYTCPSRNPQVRRHIRSWLHVHAVSSSMELQLQIPLMRARGWARKHVRTPSFVLAQFHVFARGLGARAEDWQAGNAAGCRRSVIASPLRWRPSHCISESSTQICQLDGGNENRSFLLFRSFRLYHLYALDYRSLLSTAGAVVFPAGGLSSLSSLVEVSRILDKMFLVINAALAVCPGTRVVEHAQLG